MINPKVRAKDRIYSELPEDLKRLMEAHILPEEEHMRILREIMDSSYQGKHPVQNPKFIIVCGQTGSGKSNLTASLYSKDNNIVIIDSDKYKGRRKDSNDILRKHLVEYAFLTAPDAYLHRDEMLVDAISKNYNILMECATSQKEGLFIDISKLIELGYNVELCVLGVSPLNSLLSMHERYEALMQLNNKAAKLTGIERHDDSFISLNQAVRDVQNMQRVNIHVYCRGKEFPFFPYEIYSKNNGERKFSCALEALMYAQSKDEKETMQTFDARYNIIKGQMVNRNAPAKQIQQLESIKARFDEKMLEDKKVD